MASKGGTSQDGDASETVDIRPSAVAFAAATTRTPGDAADEPAAPASVFGRYRLEERIGAGSMGVVYRAYDPMLERPVALKIVRAHRGGEHGQRRLYREAQALAQVRHPNVVSVHDVGALGEDVFVAMELVEGTPLSQWQKERDSREIIGAYLQAGRGLAAAHERGLVHRDVKPDNILVGSDGRVTVIDFGLAAVDDDSSQTDRDSLAPIPTPWPDDDSRSSLRTRITVIGSVLGTPRYMSPEQHHGERRADALSDQYSFAVALYEVLTGTFPFIKDGSASDKLEALRIAKEQATFAPPARALPSRLRRTLQRALAVDPGDRFPSMPELLDELAKDPARQRRRLAVGAVVALSLGFGAWSTIAAHQRAGAGLCQGAAEELSEVWSSERREAVKEVFLASGVGYASSTFERVASVLDGYGDDWIEMRTEACRATHVRGSQSQKVLDLRMGCLDRKRRGLQALVGVFADKPDRQVVAKAIEASLGLGGLAFCADVGALEQEVEPPERPEDRRALAELRGQLELVSQLEKLGKYQEAQALLAELGPRVEALGFPPLQAEHAYHTALTLRFLGKYAEAEPPLTEALQLALQWGMDDLAARAGAQATYLVGYSLQRHAEGLIYAQHAQGLTRGRGDELEALTATQLASVHYAGARYEKAGDYDRRALEIREAALGPDHPDVATSLNNLADDYYAQGKHREAEKLYRRALSIREKALGQEHPVVANSLNNLAGNYNAQGKHARAEKLLRRAVAIREQALGPDHPEVARSLDNLGNVLRPQNKHVEAEALHLRALAIWEKTLGPEHPNLAMSLHNLAACYHDQDKYRQAEKFNERAVAIFEKTLSHDHPYLAWPLVGLAATYEKQGRFAEARAQLERAQQIRNKAEAPAQERAEVAFSLARVLWAARRERRRARALAQDALGLYQAAGPGAKKDRLELERWLAEHR